MGKLVNFRFRLLEHLAAELGKVLVELRRNSERGADGGHVAAPDGLAPIQPERSHLIEPQRVAGAEAEYGLAVQHRIGLGLADQPPGVRRELPLDPAGLRALFVDFLARRLDQGKALGGLAASPGQVVDGEEGAVQLLEHVRDSLIALVTASDVGLAHPVRHGLPGVPARGQDHQRQQARRRQAERLALDEADLDQVAGLGELVAIARLQGVRDAHGAARRFVGAVLKLRNVRRIDQPATPCFQPRPAFLTSNQFASQDTTGPGGGAPKRSG